MNEAALHHQIAGDPGHSQLPPKQPIKKSLIVKKHRLSGMCRLSVLVVLAAILLPGVAFADVPTYNPVATRPETPRDWNLIGLMPEKDKGVKDIDHVGIAWVHLIGSTIFFGADNDKGPVAFVDIPEKSVAPRCGN